MFLGKMASVGTENSKLSTYIFFLLIANKTSYKTSYSRVIRPVAIPPWPQVTQRGRECRWGTEPGPGPTCSRSPSDSTGALWTEPSGGEGERERQREGGIYM